MDFSKIDIGFLILWFVVFLFSLSFHEAAHAWTSEKFGDSTGRYQGRITLNPLPHIDPIGTILFPLIGSLTGIPLFGWAKPVQTNPLLWRDKTKANISVSAAGPISNFILVIVAFVILKLMLSFGVLAFNLRGAQSYYELIVPVAGPGGLMEPVARLLNITLLLNATLGIFNLIPIPPLDGSHVLESLLPAPMADAYAQIRPFGFILLMVLFLVGALNYVIGPAWRFLFTLLLL